MKNKILSQSSARSAVQLVVDDFSVQNKVLTVMQVGACNGSIDNDPLHEIIKDQIHVSAHLIEAVTWLYNELVHVMAPYSGYIKSYNLAIGAKDEFRNFYYVTEQYGVDHPEVEPWKRYQIGSLTDKHLRYWVPDEYIEGIEVQCTSPSTFLKIAAVEPQDLNLLITDTEGFDGEIVTEFLTITHPEMIIYEHKVMSADENNALFLLLAEHSYEYKIIGEDVLAVRADY